MKSCTFFLVIGLFINVRLSLCDDYPSSFVTQTVYGFLDFTTTIGNTVMVFSPQSAPATLDLKVKDKESKKILVIETKPLSNQATLEEEKIIIPSKPTSASKSVVLSTQLAFKKQTVNIFPSNIKNILLNKPENDASSVVNNRFQESRKSLIHIEDDLYKPEYDLLSRQPAEYAEETYRLVNLKPSSRGHNKSRATPLVKRNSLASSENHPIGLVTKLSGTVARDGATTIHETSVIGTYISGKYAQVLQSSSHVYKNSKPKISPTSSLRILKTAAPLTSKVMHVQKETSNIRNSQRQSGLTGRFRNKNAGSDTTLNAEVIVEQSTQNPYLNDQHSAKKTRLRSKSKNRRNKNSRNSSSQKTNQQLSTSTSAEINGRRSFRPKIQPSITELEASTSLYMFKLNRTPGRWQYKTSPKPRVTIRKPAIDANASPYLNNITTSTAISIADDAPSQNSIMEQGDLESSGSVNGAILNNLDSENHGSNIRRYPVETLNVEISTPSDFKDTYYEIATIKTPYTFQAGVVKKTRFITVTSTFEKVIEPEPTETVTFEGPLMENILASSTQADRLLLDSSITTLAPLHLAADAETPHLETVTEIFSTTQKKLRTQVLPIIRDNQNTSYITLVHTYDVTSLITATKTLSPLDENQFVPSRALKDFNNNLDEAGSEINLELEFGDEENAENENYQNNIRYLNLSHHDLDLFNNQKSFIKDSSLIKSSQLTPSLLPDQIKQLALLNLFNPTAQFPRVITTSRPFVKWETLYESHTVPIINGLSTIYRTLSKSIGTVDKTEYQLETTTLELPNPPASINPFLLPQQQQFQTIITSVIQQSIVTKTNSKILKLNFGAKTAYTTLFSTNIVPTAFTSFITTSLPIQPTAAFPGYFPPPYPPYPYVG